MVGNNKLRFDRKRTGLLQSASLSALLLAGAASAQVTSADVRTVVTPDVPGAVKVTVTTTATSADGSVGFNRFKTFNVAAGHSADLRLPGTARSLVNLVQSRALIDGLVRSTRDGKIGGNLFFVVPEGMIIGPAGRIDTGRLIVRGEPGGSGDWFATNGSEYPSLSQVLGGGFSALVDISGTVNAPGGIDVKASNVTIGGVLNTGVAALDILNSIQGTAVDTAALVSTEGLVEGGKLVIRDGGIVIVAEGNVALASLDARPVSYQAGAPVVGAGIAVSGAKSIVANGQLRAWDGNEGSAAGDISLSVDKEARPGAATTELAHQAYYDNLKVKTSIDVLGAVTGGTVTIGAKALSSNQGELDLVALGLTVLQTRLQGKLIDKIFGSGAVDLSAFVSLIDASSSVTIGANSVVKAKGNLSLSADTTAASAAVAAAKASDSAALAISYSSLTSTANVTVGGTLTAGGAVSIAATNTANADVSVRAVSTGDAVTGAVAFGEADVTASVVLNNAIQGSSVAIKATNANPTGKNYEVGANGINTGNGPGGGVAAVSRLDIAAAVSGAGAITATAGDVSVVATTETRQNHVNATAITGSGSIEKIKSVTNGADAGSFTNFVFDTVEGLIAKKGDKQPQATPKARLAAATGVALVQQSGTASLTGAISATGQVAVEGLVRDASVRNNVETEVTSKRVDSGNQPAIGGAAAWGVYGYTSKALIGGDVTAQGLTVKATTDRPAGIEYSNPFKNIGAAAEGEDTLSWLSDDIIPKLTPSLGVKAGFFGTYAGSQIASDSQTKPTVGGNIAYTSVDANATAWVDRNVKLTIGTAGADVRSNVDVRNLTLAGPIPVTAAGIGIKGGSSALGGAVGLIQVNPVSVAGIDDGVTLVRAAGIGSAPVTVDAKSKVELLTLAPLSGAGGQNALIGTFGVNEVNGITHATIAKSAVLNLGGGALTLGADTSLNLGAVTGSLAVSKGQATEGATKAVSVGVSGALNLADVDTVARIGDESSDDPTKDGGSSAQGAIVAGTVDAKAYSRGQIGAFSVAGTRIEGLPEPKAPDKKPSTDTEASGVSKSTSEAVELPLSGFEELVLTAVNKYVQAKRLEAQARGFQEELAGAQSGTSPVTKGFGAAGSSSVNISKLKSRVDLVGANIVKGIGGSGGFTALAADGTDLMAITGGAALATSSKPLTSATLLAGAFGLSYSANQAAVGLSSTDLNGFADVTLRAAQTGNRIGAGLSLAVDLTKTTKGNVVAGSASVLVSRDGADTTVTGGSITGPNQGTGAVKLLAYNGLTLGAGAAGFASGSASQAGAALTLIDADNGEASAARLVGTKVSNYADLSVRALTAARVAGIAAAGVVALGTEKSTGGAVSLSYNRVDLDAQATIDTGLTANGSIAVSDEIEVYAGDLAKGSSIDLANEGLSTGRFNYAADYKPKASDFDADSGLTDAQLEGGTNILSVAASAAFAAAEAREQGLSLSVNLIDNDRSAVILGGGGATLSAGRINARALDRSAILSVGAGVAGTGGTGEVGSLSINNISGATSAGLQGRTDSPGAFRVTLTGAGQNLSVSSEGAANIYSLAGAVTVADKRAGGLAISANQILRQSAATDPNAAVQPDDAGVHAALVKVTLSGQPDVAVSALNGGAISSLAVAGTVARQGNAISGASAINRIAPVVRAHVGAIDYATANARDLQITSVDQSSIASLTAYLAGAEKATMGVGASVNLIDTRVSATLEAGSSGVQRAVDLQVPPYQIFYLLTEDFAGPAGEPVESVRLTSVPAQGRLVFESSAGLRTLNVGDTITGEELRSGQLQFEPDFNGEPVGRLSFGFVPNGRVLVRDLVVNAASKATTRSAAVGIAAAKQYALAGSVVVNATDARADAIVRLDAADIRARGSVGVIATRDTTIDTGAGTLSLSEKGSAIGASVVVNDVRGGASAQIEETGGRASITAEGATNGARVRTGELTNSLAPFEGLDVAKANVADQVKMAEAQVRGVVVNASSTHANRAIAVTGAFSANGAAATATAVVANIAGDTEARVSGVDLVSSHEADVRAGTHTASAVFAGSIAAGLNAGLAAPVISDAHSATTSAKLSGGAVRAGGALTVKAAGDQNASALAVAAGVGSGAAGIAAVSPRFQAKTHALLENVPVAATGGVLVNADSDARSYAAFGSLAASSGTSLAAAVVVATNENETRAEHLGGGAKIDGPSVTVDAVGGFDAKVVGASLAASAGTAIVGNGVGIVHRGVVTARSDGLFYDTGGNVSVHAREIATFRPIVGQLAVGGVENAGVSLGAVVVLSQSKVDADLDNALISFADKVAVGAYGGTSVDALQLGGAVAGVGIGANVTYIGVGQVYDTGALFATDAPGGDEDDKLGRNAGSTGSGNKNFDLIKGGSETTGQTASRPASDLLGAERSRNLVKGAAGTRDAAGAILASARDSFGQVKRDGAGANADDNAAARVRAQIGGGGGSSVSALSVDLTSNANLLSRSANFQGTAGIAAGSATIGITRNAANSIARIGETSSVDAGRVVILAKTDDGRSLLDGTQLSGPAKAAEAFVVGGSVGGGTVAVALADVKLQSVTLAEVRGQVGANEISVTAEDATDAGSEVYGVSGALAGALNVAVAKTVKENTVAAGLGGNVDAGKAFVTSAALGSSKAYALAAAGGNVFAGNGAAALASDRQTIDATVLEGSVVRANELSVSALGTPVVNATAKGIVVGGSVAIGASVATAESDATVRARIGEGSCINCDFGGGTLKLEAKLRRAAGLENVRASATGSAGGGLLGLNATVATARNAGRVLAELGANLGVTKGAALQLGPVQLDVMADRSIQQYAVADGETASFLLSIGAQVATAESEGEVDAAVTNVDGGGRGVTDENGRLVSAADAKIAATSNDVNTSKSIAGAGALGAGVASVATTDTGGLVTARIAPDAGKTFRAGKLDVSAKAASDYRSEADAIQASLVGGSGTRTENRVDGAARVVVGSGSALHANEMSLVATNVVGGAGSDGGSAKGSGGGALAGAAALIDNDVRQTASVEIGTGAVLRQYGDATQNEVAMTIRAVTETHRHHSTALKVGGAVVTPYAKIDSDYAAANAVTVGAGSLLRADGAIAVDTQTTQRVSDSVAVQIYGLAGVGGGAADTRTHATGTITVGNGATLESLSDVRLEAGTADLIGADATTDVFNWTALPISFEHDATSRATSANRLTLGDAVIRSARDVRLAALPKGLTATAVGTGHNPYLALFGGTDSGGDPASSGTGTIDFAGTEVTAGFLARRDLSIAAEGSGGWIATAKDFDGRNNVTRTVLYDSAGRLQSDQGLADVDSLFRYRIGESALTARQAIGDKIAVLKKQITDAGGVVPQDPNELGLNAASKDARIIALELAAATNATIAQLETAYTTRATLGPNALGTGIFVGDVFASGGLARIDTDSITGRDVSVIAQSAPRITIDHQVKRDLVLGDMFVPFKSSGPVSFGGGAGKSALAGLPGAQLVEAGANDSSDGVIAITVGKPFTADIANIVELGAIYNVGGSFSATAHNGDYAQFGTVQAGSFSVEVPSGLFSVSAGGNDFTMGVPIKLYYGKVLNTLNNGTPTITALDAAHGVVSWLAGLYWDNGVYTDGTPAARAPGALNAFLGSGTNFALLQPRSYTDIGKVVQWSACANEDCEIYDNDNELNNRLTRGHYFKNYLPGRADGGYYAPFTHYYSPVSVTNLPASFFAGKTYPVDGGRLGDANNKSANTGTIRARQVAIDAKYVNVSGDIIAGPEKYREVKIVGPDQGAPLLGQFFRDKPVGFVSQPLQTYANGAFNYEPGPRTGIISNIGVRFVVTGHAANGQAQGYLLADDIAASAGGSISITGRIVNTNPLGGGSLQVEDGHAIISVSNGTGYDLRVNTLNTGVDVSGLIKLRNIDRDGVIRSDIYRHNSGEAVRHDQLVSKGGVLVHQASTTLGTGVGTNSAISYATDQTEVWFRYDETRRISRFIGVSTTNADTVDGLYSTPWAWQAATSQPNSGFFVELSTDPVTVFEGFNAHEIRLATTNSATKVRTKWDVVQMLTGKATQTQNVGPCCVAGTNKDFFVPDRADVTLVTAVKATYPISLRFNDYGPGILNLRSDNASIDIAGPIANAGGTVVMTTNTGSIRQLDGGSVLGRNIDLRAGGSVGQLDRPIDIQIGAKFGIQPRLNAQAGSGDIVLNLSTTSAVDGGALDDVRIAGIEARNGAVSLTSNSGVIGEGGQQGFPDIIAQKIDIKAAGKVGALIVSVGEGGIAVDAGGDVTIQSNGTLNSEDVLRVRSITTPGAVLLRSYGSIVGVDNGATVDQTKLDSFLEAASTLNLTPASCTDTCTVSPARMTEVIAQIRAEGLTAYDFIARVGGLTEVEVQDTVVRIDTLASVRNHGVSLGRDGRIVYDPDQDTNGDARRIAMAQIRKTDPDAMELPPSEIGAVFQSIFDPIAPIVGTTLPDLNGLQLAAKVAAVQALVQNSNRTAAANDAYGRLQQLDTLRAQGVAIDAAGRVTVTPSSATAKGGTLYRLALETLKSGTESLKANGGFEVVANPTQSDIARGLQRYVDNLAADILPLFGNQLPSSASVADLAVMIRADGLAAYNLAGRADAIAKLTEAFGGLPVSRTGIATASVNEAYLAARTEGATWRQSQLDFQLPSTAFTPVADTQFELRAPIIKAGSLTLIAGNSIGNFADAQTFRFTRDGMIDDAGAVVTDETQKKIARAYLASAGPGDLAFDVFGQPIQQVNVTTRRDRPLVIDVAGTVNAFAATDLRTLTLRTDGTDTETLNGDILLTNLAPMQIGSIVSLKPVFADLVGTSDCSQLSFASAGGCESRVRLVAPSLIGVTSGAAQLADPDNYFGFNGPLNAATNADGRAIVVGGRIRLEASTGDLRSANGGALLFEGSALEVVRAGGDARLERVAPRLHYTGNGFPSSGYVPHDPYSFATDLTLGDVFAGGAFTLTNAHGSILAGALPSPIEPRNARIVASSVALLAAGDIGSDSLTAAGLAGRLDIQAATISRLVAGQGSLERIVGGPERYLYEDVNCYTTCVLGQGFFFRHENPAYATGIFIDRMPSNGELLLYGTPVHPFRYFTLDEMAHLGWQSTFSSSEDDRVSFRVRYDNPAPGDLRLITRGTTLLGGADGLEFAAKGAAAIHQANGSDLTIDGAIKVGSTLDLFSNGALRFDGRAAVNRSGQAPAAVCVATPNAAGCAVDASAMNLTLATDAKFATDRHIVLNTLAGEGTSFTSRLGSVRINRLLASRHPDKLTTVNGAASVSIGTIDHGSALLTSNEAVAITDYGYLSNLTIIAPVVTFGGYVNALGAIDVAARRVDIAGRALGGRVRMTGSLTRPDLYMEEINFLSGNQGVSAFNDLTLFAQRTTGTSRTIDGSTLDVRVRSDLSTFNLLATNGGKVLVDGVGSDLSVGNYLSVGGAMTIAAGGDVNFTRGQVSGSMQVTAGNNISIGEGLTIGRQSAAGALNMTAVKTISGDSTARLIGGRTDSSLALTAGTIDLGPLTSVTDLSVNANAKGTARFGTVAGLAANQNLTIKGVTRVAVGDVTGLNVTLASSGGDVTTGQVTGTRVIIDAKANLRTGGIEAGSATVTGKADVALAGRTRITAGKLLVTAANAVSIEGQTSASGGMTLTGKTVQTIGGGFLSDPDALGALTSLRADNTSVRFDTGATMGAAVRVDVRGRTGGNAEAVDLRFDTLRAVTMPSLFTRRGTVSLGTLLTIDKLNMAEWLLLKLGSQSVALRGAVAAPPAGRTIETGSLTGARLVATPGANGAQPTIRLNNTLR